MQEIQALRHNRSYPFKRTSLVLEQSTNNNRSADSIGTPSGKQPAAPTGVTRATNTTGRITDIRMAGRGKTVVKESPYAKNTNIKCF